MPLSIVVPIYDMILKPVFQGDWFDQRIRKIGEEVIVYHDETISSQEYADRIRNKDAVLVTNNIPHDVFDYLNEEDSPRLISFCFTGIMSGTDIPKIKAKGTQCANVLHYNDYGIAEHALALLLASNRNIPELDRRITEGEWPEISGKEVKGKTVAVIGFGGVGKEFARMVKALGAEQIIVWDKFIDQDAVQSLGARVETDLSKLMSEADIVSIHLGFNEQTAGIITSEHLNQLRSGATIVNTARAEVVEPGAMYRRMARGDVAGAFDVFEIEPLPKGDPMAKLPNVIKTSHNAFRTPETTYSMIDLGIRNIESFISGNPVNIV